MKQKSSAHMERLERFIEHAQKVRDFRDSYMAFLALATIGLIIATFIFDLKDLVAPSVIFIVLILSGPVSEVVYDWWLSQNSPD